MRYLARQTTKKDFLHKIVTGDEKWITYENLKRKKSWVDLGRLTTSTAKHKRFRKKVLLCMYGGIRKVCCTMSSWGEPGKTIKAEIYQEHLIRLSNAIEKKGHLLNKAAIKSSHYTTMLNHVHTHSRSHKGIPSYT